MLDLNAVPKGKYHVAIGVHDGLFHDRVSQLRCETAAGAVRLSRIYSRAIQSSEFDRLPPLLRCLFAEPFQPGVVLIRYILRRNLPHPVFRRFLDARMKIPQHQLDVYSALRAGLVQVAWWSGGGVIPLYRPVDIQQTDQARFSCQSRLRVFLYTAQQSTRPFAKRTSGVAHRQDGSAHSPPVCRCPTRNRLTASRASLQRRTAFDSEVWRHHRPQRSSTSRRKPTETRFCSGGGRDRIDRTPQMRTGLTIRSTCTGETGSSTQSEKARHEVLLMESGLFALTLQ